MAKLYHRLLFLFVDGVGLARTGSPGPESTNPFEREGTPALDALLGGSLTSERCRVEDELLLAPLDATLGVPGLPQSSTGQTSLFSGHNGAAVLGMHRTGLPGPRMRRLVEKEGLFLRAVRAGLSATFANAYSEEYLGRLEAGTREPSVTTVAVRAAGLELRDLDDLARGDAVTWDYCRDLAAERLEVDIPAIEPETAGRHLVGIAEKHDLTVHESFLTDLGGHLKRGVEAGEAVRRLDRVIAGIEAVRGEDLSWILTSDHGNVEDTSTGSHTLNPVPLLVVGPAARSFAGASSILDVTPLILRTLERS